MSATASTMVPWWKEPTKDQWHAWVAAWLGWTLDAFDFFLLTFDLLGVDLSVTLRLMGVVECFDAGQTFIVKLFLGCIGRRSPSATTI